jgi:hypothetical protein
MKQVNLHDLLPVLRINHVFRINIDRMKVDMMAFYQATEILSRTQCNRMTSLSQSFAQYGEWLYITPGA